MSPKKTKAKTFPMVHVKWRDASHSGADGWIERKDLQEKLPWLAAESCGFLVHEGKNQYGEECIGLASALVFNEDDWPDFCLSFVIPKEMIISMRKMR